MDSCILHSQRSSCTWCDFTEKGCAFHKGLSADMFRLEKSRKLLFGTNV